ncbi:MAG: hypothetical protein ACI8YI_000688, partial [Paracoccaceae bacterium]
LRFGLERKIATKTASCKAFDHAKAAWLARRGLNLGCLTVAITHKALS